MQKTMEIIMNGETFLKILDISILQECADWENMRFIDDSDLRHHRFVRT